MRKLLFLFFTIAVSLTLLGTSQATVNGIPLRDFPQQSILFDSLTLKSKNHIENIILLPEEEFDQIEAANMISRIDKLPDSMLEKIAHHRIQLKLFQGKLTDNPSADHLKGLIPRGYQNGTKWDEVPGVGGSKIVLAKIGNSEKGMGHGSVNLELHELAHSVDRYVYDAIRDDQTFVFVWKKESKLLFPGRPYFINYPEEYFAETFAMFFAGDEHTELLREAAPETYLFIKSLK
ncbi:anthrax toxin lethal factor-related metalloendopeptidase [Mesobacillus harenae]|uniref:anthrax toxin lethal factor-related metalloendopeptidase n=1 Tax=Mesobacillus harenae TaxID=2213203 RepID=UPI00157FEA01|nr:toxin [Mesobacillus harenae]